MDAKEYRQAVLNLVRCAAEYARAKQGGQQLSERRKACIEAGHAMANCWALADHHAEGAYADPVAAAAWSFLAHRWEASVEHWAAQLPDNEARAALAPIKERRAIEQWPTFSSHPDGGAADASVTSAGAATSEHDSVTRRTDASFRATAGGES